MQKIERFFKKPEYYFRPSQLYKRLFDSSLFKHTHTDLLWGHKSFEINPKETIGKSIQTFGLYDLVICEALFRLVKKDSLCLDVGANIGIFSSLMQSQGGKVHSFEPHPQVFQRLKRNSKAFPNITCHNLALSETKGSLDLHIPKKFSGNEGIASIAPQDDSEKVLIQTETIDNLFSDQIIDVMKVDVEGHELAVFKGAQRLIEQKKIKHIIFEEFGGEKAGTIQFLNNNNYKVFRLKKGYFNLKLISPEEGMSLPLWEPANYIASFKTPDWSSLKSWQVLKL